MPKSNTQRVDLVREMDELRKNSPALAQSYVEFLESFNKFQEMERQFKKESDSNNPVTSGIRLLA